MDGGVSGFNRLYGCFLHLLRPLDGLGPLALRLFVGPIFILAGWNKLTGINDVAAWFGNPDWGLGLPAPVLMAWLAALTEYLGGIALLLGLGVRLAAIPLMVVMAVAAVTAHWQYGWHALPEQTLTMPWEWREDLIEEAVVRRERAVELLKAHGNYNWLTEAGSFTVLKNGIEFAATYFVMVLALLCTGGGRYVSLDYWIARRRGLLAE
ncbi:DoxX family protein [Microbulbifer hydrolyticus]|uniref:DoxX family membrane protein n=1 Tax=Microbulbifer hydrolyticus TaxID=48074 RepID=A0A6P1TAW0_9GAMM|nr:DoxX family protein [Microbulbifer hydrolyticus]MBB5212783.1 putative membrane protein YphA (DoxX/SURF4 family) [Microbulbifer hydrolyticus]QHQ38419.1 DoxX family membrane protein [Microbulbifer hydrolyticus]